MNERIREIAGLCYEVKPSMIENSQKIGRDGVPLYNEVFNQEKFAELIVKECVQTLRDNTPVLDENESVEDWNKGYIRAMLDCEHHITEHFGIK